MEILDLHMDDRLQFRKTLETYVKFWTAWTAFKQDPALVTMEELNRRYADFSPYIPGFDLSAKLNAFVGILSDSAPWSGAEFRGCVEIAGGIIGRIHDSIQDRVHRYPEDAADFTACLITDQRSRSRRLPQHDRVELDAPQKGTSPTGTDHILRANYRLILPAA